MVALFLALLRSAGVTSSSSPTRGRERKDLRIYTIYAPPNHIDGRVHRTKADADADHADEEFGHSVGG